MNGVLTHKELRMLQKNKAKEPVKKDVPEKVVVVETPPEPLDNTSEKHFLFHPDNPKNSSEYRNGVHYVRVNGVELALPLVNGVLETDSVLAKNQLIKQGFVFMYSKPKE